MGLQAALVFLLIIRLIAARGRLPSRASSPTPHAPLPGRTVEALEEWKA